MGNDRSPPKTGASPINGQIFRQISVQLPASFSITKRIPAIGNFEVTKAIRTPLNQLIWGLHQRRRRGASNAASSFNVQHHICILHISVILHCCAPSCCIFVWQHGRLPYQSIPAPHTRLGIFALPGHLILSVTIQSDRIFIFICIALISSYHTIARHIVQFVFSSNIMPA